MPILNALLAETILHTKPIADACPPVCTEFSYKRHVGCSRYGEASNRPDYG